eukprot:3368166-Rhodomonas_salina.3
MTTLFSWSIFASSSFAVIACTPNTRVSTGTHTRFSTSKHPHSRQYQQTPTLRSVPAATHTRVTDNRYPHTRQNQQIPTCRNYRNPRSVPTRPLRAPKLLRTPFQSILAGETSGGLVDPVLPSRPQHNRKGRYLDRPLFYILLRHLQAARDLRVLDLRLRRRLVAPYAFSVPDIA